jgi:hypothetical protein
MYKYLVGIVAILFVGCKSPKTENKEEGLTYDPDVLAPFINDDRITYTNYLSEGSFVFQLKPEMEYSLTFKSKLGELSKKPVSELRVNTKVFPKTNTEISLVVEITNQGKSLLYKNIKLSEVCKTLNQWQDVSITAKLNTPLIKSPSNEVKIYLWNYGKGEVMMDALNLSFR